MILASCFSEKKEVLPNFSNKIFLEMARKGDPDLKLVIPSDISETLVSCSDYTPACRYGLKVIVKKVEMRALFYENQDDALECGKRIKGYVARNWVLDEVAGEPILERYVTKYLEAKKASESVIPNP
jgi:hypothetical protein